MFQIKGILGKAKKLQKETEKMQEPLVERKREENEKAVEFKAK